MGTLAVFGTIASTLLIGFAGYYVLALVGIGLLIGNQGRALAMTDQTRVYLDMFWELVDEILNAVLFVLMGLEVAVFAQGLTVGALARAVTVDQNEYNV